MEGLLLPALIPKVPLSQRVHDVFPSPVSYDPAWQAMHVLESLAPTVVEYDALKQRLEQLICCKPVLYVPAAQSAHAVPLVSVEYVPLAQDLQNVLCEPLA